MLLVFFYLITLVCANTSMLNLDCDSTDPSDELLPAHSNLANVLLPKRNTFPDAITIETYVHIFADNTTYKGGWLNVCLAYFHIHKSRSQNRMQDTTIEKQIQVLNSGFNNTPFMFTLKGISRNVTRLPDDNRVDTAALFKAKFRKGDYRTSICTMCAKSQIMVSARFQAWRRQSIATSTSSFSMAA